MTNSPNPKLIRYVEKRGEKFTIENATKDCFNRKNSYVCQNIQHIRQIALAYEKAFNASLTCCLFNSIR
jgi:hypothetical protein